MILLVGILPFRLLYVFSDMMFVIIYYFIGYRRKVVVANLTASFPEKNTAEIKELSKKFYHHLCDISLESLKGFTMPAEEIVKRHYIVNPEIANQYFDQGIGIIAVPGHYNNWEWGSLSPGLQIKNPIVAFYKPMNNKLVDSYIKNHRAKYHTRLASIRQTSATFSELESAPYVMIMAADQCPSNRKECYWIDFLNRETAWLHGPEKYARKYNLPVIYIDIQKVKRGFYELKLVVLTENPASLPAGKVTKRYANSLESSIRNEPAYWLWSHKRWKYGRE